MDAGTPAPEVVRLDRAEISVGGRRILGPLDLVVRADERWVVLGPNGSGKTTMLGLAGARRYPTTGSVTILGRRLGRVDTRGLHPRIGHGSHALTELMPRHLSALDVVMTGTRSSLVTWLQPYDEHDRRIARERLTDVGCAPFADRAFMTLSQGERQRVLLARALVGDPELLILDEPAAGLDLPAREALIAALEAASRTGGPAMLIATHHLEEIPPSATHAALLRRASLVAAGPIETTLTETNLRATFDLPGLEIGRRRGRWWAAASPA